MANNNASQGNANQSNQGSPSTPNRPVYIFFVGKVKYETTEPRLTVRQILEEYAKVDPTKKTLAEKKGDMFTEYKDLNESLDLGHARHFTLFDETPLPVS